jgi:hypothetical protein
MILAEGDKSWEDSLRRIDEVLEDAEWVDRVEESLAQRRAKRRRRR